MGKGGSGMWGVETELETSGPPSSIPCMGRSLTLVCHFHFEVSLSSFMKMSLFHIVYPLVGTLVKVWGTNNRVNGTAGWDPTWECFVDNVSIGATDPFPYDENNWLLCAKAGINDGLHEIKVIVTTTGQPFWFDYIQYAPSSSVSEETAYIVVDNLDSGLQYGGGWTALGSTANMTNYRDTEFRFNFTGS